MKYLSVLLFICAMAWSWSYTHRERPITEQIHLSIQNDLKKLISEYIQKNLPNSNNLQFDRFWTESMSINKVKASFVYSFEDKTERAGNARVAIEGYAVLNRAQETAESIEWNFDELVILNDHVDYQDPLQISPASATEEE
jgi:hypothetical protein